MNRPVARIRGHVDDFRPTQNATSGGSIDTDVNEFTDSPRGAPASSAPVTMVTPVAK